MKIRLFLVGALIAFQVCALIFVSAAREYERATKPSFRLRCEPVDPRDLLRGDYIILHFSEGRDIPFSMLDAAAQAEVRRYFPREPEMENEGGYGELISSEDRPLWLTLAPDADAGGEVATASPYYSVRGASFTRPLFLPKQAKWVCIPSKQAEAAFFLDESAPNEKTKIESLRIDARDAFPDQRFYLPEGKADPARVLEPDAKIELSAEVFARDDGTIVPKALFLNDQPYLKVVNDALAEKAEKQFENP